MSNRYITYCALAKLNFLKEKHEDCSVIKMTENPLGGFEIVFSNSLDNYNIILSNSPLITTDTFTFTHLSDSSIDYDYDSGDFIITRENNVIST